MPQLVAAVQYLQFDPDTLLNKSRRKGICVNLQNNTAITGNAVYGGQIDECYFLVDNTPWKNKFLLHQKSGKIFNDTFIMMYTIRQLFRLILLGCVCVRIKLQIVVIKLK